MVIVIISLIVAVLVINDKYQNLKRENEKLTKTKSNNLSFCPKCGTDLRQYGIPQFVNFNPQNNTLTIPPNEISTNNKTKKVKEQIATLSKEEQKNNFILITGAILIVLSAIIFLGSTWMSTSNITKTFIILLMLIIFFIISKISEKKFNLKQTSLVFFYIALCYIPIAMLSISLFGLFGHYLSIYGSGRYVYYSTSCLLISIIYYITYKNKPTVFLKILLEIFLYLTIFFSSCIFNIDIYIYSIIIITYTIIRKYISIKTNNLKKEDQVLYALLDVKNIIIAIFICLISFISTNVSVFIPVQIILNLLSLYISCNKIFKLSHLYDYIYPILVIITFVEMSNITLFNLSFTSKQIITLLSFIPLVLYDIYINKNIKLSTIFSITVTTIILAFLSIDRTYIIPSIIISIYLGIVIINYILTKDNKKIMSYLTTITVIALSLFLKYDLELSNFYILLVPELILLISLVYKNMEENLKTSSYQLGLIALCLEFFRVAYYDISYLNTIAIILGGIILISYFIVNNKEIQKNIAYVLLTTGVVLLLELTSIEHSVTYGISISTLFIILLETFIPRLKTENSYTYLLLSSILSLIMLNTNLNNITLLIIVAIDLLIVYYNMLNKRDKSLIYLIAVSLLPSIYFSDLLIIEDFNGMILISILLIALSSYISYIKKNINEYTIISFLYTIFMILFLDINIYVNNIVLLAVSLSAYFSNNTNKKDIFKTISYISGLIIIKQILIDFALNDITLLSIGSILIFSILVNRTIIKNHFSEYKFIEYFTTSIINLIAIINYSGEIDGILYVTLLIILIFISYIYKLGPLLLTSIIFVILNAIILTREFWLSLPWWIYVLGIGIILVLFAMRNEAHNNESKEKINKIKNDLDL